MKRKSRQFSILDRDVTIEGTLSAKGQLIIKGTVRGKLTGEDVIIAEEGVFHAEAKVVRMTVGGKFEGHVAASEELVILSTGHCSGKIVCKDFVVEPGGVLNAEVNCMAYQNRKGGQTTPPKTETPKAPAK